jgi:hypothetical protein
MNKRTERPGGQSDLVIARQPQSDPPVFISDGFIEAGVIVAIILCHSLPLADPP